MSPSGSSPALLSLLGLFWVPARLRGLAVAANACMYVSLYVPWLVDRIYGIGEEYEMA